MSFDMNPNPNQLTPVIEARLKTFSDAIVNRPPLCSGTWDIPTDSFQLSFKKGDDSAGWLNLLKATEMQFESLAMACTPATFGADGKDVMDLSYRKAGKMDVVDFMARFDPDRLGLSDFVRSQLLEGDEDSKGLKTELYKLNVYGKDSFFKSHKDTPRGVDMIGSLVVIFPTAHKAGALILRHNDQEYTFDSGLELSRVKNPSIAFVAFYSDVEHEVTLVESGYRVSLTYNLYVTAPAQEKNLLRAPMNYVMPNELKLKQALSDLLAEETFLPEGGTIGFGLLHQYPISRATTMFLPEEDNINFKLPHPYLASYFTQTSLPEAGSIGFQLPAQVPVSNLTTQTFLPEAAGIGFQLPHQAPLSNLTPQTLLPKVAGIGFELPHQYRVSQDKESLDSVLNCLKGRDSAIRRVCTSLGLELEAKVIYKETYGNVLILTKEFIDLGYVDRAFESLLCVENNRKGFIVKSRGLAENGGGEFEHKPRSRDQSRYRYKEVWWLTKRTELTRERCDFVAYGNEAELAHTYGDVVLIAKVGGHGNRRVVG